MAINVDLVYKTVLLILNQQQRGNITPDEFNKVGTQVQLGIFEKYMSDLNQQLRVPENDSEYGNRVKNIEEKIDIFKRIGEASYANPHFNLPTTTTSSTNSQSITVPATPNPNIITVYNINNWSTAQSQGALVKIYVNGVLQTSPANYSFNSNTNNITFVTAPLINSVIVAQLYPSDFYRLGSVIYNDSIEAQMVDRNEWYLIKKAPLVAPTKSQPVFLYENSKISIFPTTITSDIQVSYIKKPADVQWGYSVGGLGQFEYNSATSVNFELHVSEQVDIIMGILLYSGVIIQDPTIIQVASQKVQQEDINEKS